MCSSDLGNGSENHDVILMNNGVDLPLFALEGVDDGEFSLVANPGIVTMVSTNQAGIRITKEFIAGTNYLLHSTITLTNPKTEPVALPQRKLMLGTAMPLQSGGRYPVWGAQWHNGADMEDIRSEEHTSELQSRRNLVCCLLLEKKKVLSCCTLNLSLHHILTVRSYFTPLPPM